MVSHPPIVQVDDSGNVIDPIMYKDAHNAHRPVRHATSHVLVFDSPRFERVLLQKRGGSADKPGAYDSSATGHIDWIVDEDRPMTPEETAFKEFSEELFHRRAPQCISLEFITTCLKHTRPADREFNYIFRAVHPDPFHPNPNEVSEATFFGIDFLLEDIERNRLDYTDSVWHILSKYLEATDRYR